MSAARRMAARRRERWQAPRHLDGDHECPAPLFSIESIGGDVLYFACHICEHQSASLIAQGRREARRR